jgi:archaemetzincin
LIPIGEVTREVLEALQNAIGEVFRAEVAIGPGLSEPASTFDPRRNQYHSSALLRFLTKQVRRTIGEQMLAIIDHDLYVPGMNFVFGEAAPGTAVISLARLRQEFYGLPTDPALFLGRVVTEAVHELGHSCGLHHCRDPRCVMWFSNSIQETDRKGREFCGECRKQMPAGILREASAP